MYSMMSISGAIGGLLFLLAWLPLPNFFWVEAPLGRPLSWPLLPEKWSESPYWLKKLPKLSIFDPLRARASDVRWNASSPHLHKRADESLVDWMTRLNSYVYRFTEHCNTITGFIGPIESSGTAMYGINVAGAVVCGLCGQRAYWLQRLLRQSGVQGELLRLMGHVVLVVEDGSSGKHWVLDPDYGSPPFLVNLASSDEMRRAATENYQFLAEAGYVQTFSNLVGFYESTHDNALYDMAHLDYVHFMQSRWLPKLWPIVMADLQEEALASRRADGAEGEKRGERVAKALHAAFVAAERKYGLEGHGAKNIELNALDFISQTRTTSPATGKALLEIINWGYRTTRLSMRGATISDCSLHESDIGRIEVPPHASMLIDPEVFCGTAGLSLGT